MSAESPVATTGETQPAAAPAAAASPAPAACLNCGAVLSGSYCAACGQRSDVHVPSMDEVAHDFVHSVLHLDSTVWRTLRSLVLKPGELTNAFIAGRRASYLPPFRLYLVMSIAFFALSSMLPDAGSVSVNPAGGGAVAPVQLTLPGTGPEDAQKRMQEAAGQLGRIAADPETPAALRELAGEVERQVATDRKQAGCAVETGWGWLDGLLAQACAGLAAEGGKRVGEVFLANAPKFMFVFLPLMAAVAMLFYWKPRRLYAEHLVLFLHVHAFVFLWLIATSLVNAVTQLELPLVGMLGALNVALMLCLPWYVYRAMRVVYGDGPRRTVAKMAAMGTGYFAVLGLTMAVALVYSMLSL
jgi:hypothetical protein